MRILAVLALTLAAAAPNDPGWPQQWGLQKIHAAQAWALGRGAGVIVAVVDTGVDATHPDLRGRVVRGRDFVDGDADASDVKGHGTHVAGIIAASTGNGIGVASVAPAAKILPIRVLGADGEGDPGDVAEGIRWAVDRGARVINLSLAQDEDLPLPGDRLLGDTRVDEAITQAARRGAVVVVAAGNDDRGGRSQTAYRARVPGVIVVGASTRDDRRAAYSNYGDGLDVLAPGGGSASDPKACAPGTWIVSTWWNPATKRSDYGGGCGTSMAVAHVSGIAALLLATGSTNVEAVQRIRTSAVDLGPRGRDPETGYGRVDAFRALSSSSSQGGIVRATPSVPARPPAGRPEPSTVAIGPEEPERRSRTLPVVAVVVFLIALGGHVRRAWVMFH